MAVLIAGQHVEIHRIERDDFLIARLMHLEQQFWQYVVTDTPPPADGSASAEQALRTLRIALSSDREAMKLLDQIAAEK